MLSEVFRVYMLAVQACAPQSEPPHFLDSNQLALLAAMNLYGIDIATLDMKCTQLKPLGWKNQVYSIQL